MTDVLPPPEVTREDLVPLDPQNPRGPWLRLKPRRYRWVPWILVPELLLVLSAPAPGSVLLGITLLGLLALYTQAEYYKRFWWCRHCLTRHPRGAVSCRYARTH